MTPCRAAIFSQQPLAYDLRLMQFERGEWAAPPQPAPQDALVPRQNPRECDAAMPAVKDVPVLVVEDDDDTREVLRTLLAGEGYRVLEARDGREGLDLLRVTRGPLVVLLDWWMPRMDGLQMLGAAARLGRRRNRHHRYVLISASFEPRELERRGLPALLGVQVLRKPFNIDDVLAEVERQAAGARAGATDDGADGGAEDGRGPGALRDRSAS